MIHLFLAEGELYTWGSSGEGQTGQRDEECVVPTRVHLKGKVTAVACGYYHMAVATGESQPASLILLWLWQFGKWQVQCM